jgi:hypothetical protein
MARAGERRWRRERDLAEEKARERSGPAARWIAVAAAAAMAMRESSTRGSWVSGV